ncbi:MAG: hypothetical protein JW727_06790 [Candidatus Aenigmarchaeota archaeon]|nr:hypothetical protein [Candidatus Aenigmarchaeota archaeon]
MTLRIVSTFPKNSVISSKIKPCQEQISGRLNEKLLSSSSEMAIFEVSVPKGCAKEYLHEGDSLIVVLSGPVMFSHGAHKEELRSGNFRFITGGTPYVIEGNQDHKALFCRFESGSNLDGGGNGKEIVLLDRNRATDYLMKQKSESNPENKFPINITTNLGMTREVYTPKSILKSCGYVDLSFAALIEVFVPSIKSIEKASKTLGNDFDQFLVKLNETALNRSGGLLNGDDRDIHGNVWDELFIVISGELTFVEFEPSEEIKELMRANNGSVYELDSASEVRKRNFKNLTIRRLGVGDIYFSPAGCAHGVFHGKDALYLVFINKNKEFEHWMGEFWGKGSLKYNLNRKFSEELKKGNVGSVSSYWGEYHKKTASQ